MTGLSVLLLLLPLAPSAAGSSVAVTAELHARRLAPGEPVLFRVRAPEPLESLQAEFLGHPAYFSPTGSGSDPEVWWGWSMIDLDQSPGIASIEFSGTSLQGRPVVGTHAVTILENSFPSERLDVAPKYVEPPAEVRERLAVERRALGQLYASRRPIPPDLRTFGRPVPGEPTSVFGTRRIYNGKPRAPHPGLDLRAAEGTPVVSSGPGRIAMARDLYYSGNTVIVDHGGGLFTLYAHLSAILVDEGEDVDFGQTLGHSGSTGRVTGPHLHWGAKIGDRPFDPSALLDSELFR